MTTLITGGSKCGKSSLAERSLDGFSGKKFYIAAMMPFGEDAREAIERHRKMRSGRGFTTIEKYTDIHEIEVPPGSAVLLECVGNLCANEMFGSDALRLPADKIVSGIQHLASQCEKLVIITNQVGSDGISYEEGTAAYIREMGKINAGIASFADNVIECVYGIPVVLKGEMIC